MSRGTGSLSRVDTRSCLKWWWPRLDAEESEKVRDSLLEPGLPEFRLEIYGFRASEGAEPGPRDQVEDVVRRVFAIQCCVVRATPRWPSVVLDRHDGRSWQRVEWLDLSGGNAPFVFYGAWKIPEARMASWGEILAHFPALGRFPVLDLALEYFYDSVVDRKAHPHKAFMSASTAHEVLLGPREGLPIRRTLSMRGAALTVPASQSDVMQTLIGEWYVQRSKLVHEGRRPTEEEAVRHQQYLMRAIPAMAALALHHDDYDAALAALDSAANNSGESLPDGFTQSGKWWSKVNVLEALQHAAFEAAPRLSAILEV